MRCRLPMQRNAPGAGSWSGSARPSAGKAAARPGFPWEKMLEECGGSVRIRGPNREHEARGAHPGR